MFIHNFIKNQNMNFYFLKVIIFLKVVIFYLNLRKIFSNDQRLLKLPMLLQIKALKAQHETYA